MKVEMAMKLKMKSNMKSVIAEEQGTCVHVLRERRVQTWSGVSVPT